jgi:hypothetical protein
MYWQPKANIIFFFLIFMTKEILIVPILLVWALAYSPIRLFIFIIIFISPAYRQQYGKFDLFLHFRNTGTGTSSHFLFAKFWPREVPGALAESLPKDRHWLSTVKNPAL